MPGGIAPKEAAAAFKSKAAEGIQILMNPIGPS
jgi:hypothetical protein